MVYRLQSTAQDKNSVNFALIQQLTADVVKSRLVTTGACKSSSSWTVGIDRSLCRDCMKRGRVGNGTDWLL